MTVQLKSVPWVDREDCHLFMYQVEAVIPHSCDACGAMIEKGVLHVSAKIGNSHIRLDYRCVKHMEAMVVGFNTAKKDFDNVITVSDEDE